MNKKSQAALEFLTSYIWVILGILILIGALSYFGILSPKKLLGDRCNFGSEIGCMNYKIANNGVQLKLKNNVGNAIIVDGIIASTKKVEINCISQMIGSTWEAGDIKDNLIHCDFTDAGLVPGEKEKLNLEITYHTASAGSTFSKTVRGEVFAVVEGLIIGTSCKDYHDGGFLEDGEYTIDPDGSGSIAEFQVYCDMTTDGGGWTLLMRIENNGEHRSNNNQYGPSPCTPTSTTCKLSTATITQFIQQLPGVQVLEIRPDDPTYVGWYVRSGADTEVWPSNLHAPNRAGLLANPNEQWIITGYTSLSNAEAGVDGIPGTYDGSNHYYPTMYNAQNRFFGASNGLRSHKEGDQSDWDTGLPGTLWIR